MGENVALIRRMREIYASGAYAARRATLHAHSDFSDGTMPPLEFLETAAKQGFRTVSITDHDTMAAYVQEVPAADGHIPLVAHARRLGIELITGVELTCWWRWHPVHILAFGLPPDDEHVMRLCVTTQLAGSKRISFHWWPVQAMTICQLVLALGGVPVLAHPRFYWVNVPRMIEELVTLGGLVGVETEYTYHTHHLSMQCPIWTYDRIAALADRFDLVRTGGADSHGRDLAHYRRG